MDVENARATAEPAVALVLRERRLRETRVDKDAEEPEAKGVARSDR